MRFLPESLIRLTVVLYLLFGFVAQSSAARLHLLLAADTNDPEIGRRLFEDIEIMKKIFVANVARQALSITTLTGNRAYADSLLQAVRRLNVESNDIVVFYFSGHGAFDTNRNDHYFGYVRRKPLLRNKLRTALKATNARTVIILTDTCSNVRNLPPTGAARWRPKASPLFRSLFYKPSGLIDISCTKRGEYGLSLPRGGSLFTKTFRDVLAANSQRQWSWPQMLAKINQVTSTARVRGKPHKQTAYAVRPIGEQWDRGGRSQAVVSRATKTDGKRGEVFLVKVAYNQKYNGRLGMWIYPQFDVRGGKGKKGFVYIYFNCLGCDKRLDARRGSPYSDRRGQLVTSIKISPSYDDARFKQAQLFMAYREIWATGKHTNLSFDIHVHIRENAKEVHCAGSLGHKFQLKDRNSTGAAGSAVR